LTRSSFFESVRTSANYNGEGNLSLLELAGMPEEAGRNGTCCFSYFVTSCFQHIYLATSSLWGEGSLLGPTSDEVEVDNNVFRWAIIKSVCLGRILQANVMLLLLLLSQLLAVLQYISMGW